MDQSLDSPSVERQQHRVKQTYESSPSLQEQQHKKQRSMVYPEIDWKLEEFNPSESLKKLESIKCQQEIQMQKQAYIEVEQFEEKGTGMSKYVAYRIKGKDKHGEFEVYRRFKQFDLLHQRLTIRWPGIYLPAIPNKTIIGNTEKQVSSNRMRFLNNFLQKIMVMPAVYYGEEVQAFLKSSPQEVQKILEGFKKQTDQEILRKYKQSFTEIENVNLAQVDIDNFFGSTDDLRDSKTDLVLFKNNLKRLAELRDNYKSKQKNLFANLMPEFQSICFEWWENKSLETVDSKQRIFTDAGLKNSFQQQSPQNNPFWFFFDIVKFELRQIDGIVSAVQNAKTVLNKKKYLQRTIAINKQQIEALKEKQMTLKTFMMGGNQEQKRANLLKESQACQAQLIDVNELYTIVAALGIRSVKNFYQEKLSFYKQMFGKVSKEELSNTNHQIKFHLSYESSIQA